MYAEGISCILWEEGHGEAEGNMGVETEKGKWRKEKSFRNILQRTIDKENSPFFKALHLQSVIRF